MNETQIIWITIQKASFNTLRPRRNEQHFADDIYKCIFFDENVWISIKISMKFVSKGPINNIPALVQIIVWHRPGDKPLSEPMMVRLPTHICVTRPQWVKKLYLKYVICEMLAILIRFQCILCDECCTSMVSTDKWAVYFRCMGDRKHMGCAGLFIDHVHCRVREWRKRIQNLAVEL